MTVSPRFVLLSYFAAIRLIYGMRNGKKLGDSYNMGAVPYGNLTTQQNVYQGGNFSDGIADGPPTGPTGQGGGGGGGPPNPPGVAR